MSGELPRWVKTNDAARIVCCHPEVLRRWHRTRTAPFRLPEPKRRGREFLWDVEELIRAMEEIEPDGARGHSG
ncbi:hypothetical protein [Nocardia tengchongensis]|uniref:hypothetical protein n=1 Tax=Nocardia tengchongensis TaxID=2055889 RepID=UPI0036BA906F